MRIFFYKEHAREYSLSDDSKQKTDLEIFCAWLLNREANSHADRVPDDNHSFTSSIDALWEEARCTADWTRIIVQSTDIIASHSYPPAHAYLCRGNAYAMRNQLYNAAVDVTIGLESQPTFHTRHYLLCTRSIVFRLLGNCFMSIKDITAAANDDIRDIDAIFVKLQTEVKLQEWNRVVSDCNFLINLKASDSLSPSDSIVYYFKGRALEELNRMNEAVECFSLEILSNPSGAASYSSRCKIYSTEGKWEGAVHDATEAISHGDRSLPVLLVRATGDMELKEYARAVADLDEILISTPRHAQALYNRSIAHGYLENWSFVIDDITLLLEVGVGSGLYGDDLYRRRGIAHQMLGNMEQALIDLDQAIKAAENKSPELASRAYLSRASAFNKCAMWEDCTRDCETAVKLSPKYRPIANRILQMTPQKAAGPSSSVLSSSSSSTTSPFDDPPVQDVPRLLDMKSLSQPASATRSEQRRSSKRNSKRKSKKTRKGSGGHIDPSTAIGDVTLTSARSNTSCSSKLSDIEKDMEAGVECDDGDGLSKTIDGDLNDDGDYGYDARSSSPPKDSLQGTDVDVDVVIEDWDQYSLMKLKREGDLQRIKLRARSNSSVDADGASETASPPISSSSPRLNSETLLAWKKLANARGAAASNDDTRDSHIQPDYLYNPSQEVLHTPKNEESAFVTPLPIERSKSIEEDGKSISSTQGWLGKIGTLFQFGLSPTSLAQLGSEVDKTNLTSSGDSMEPSLTIQIDPDRQLSKPSRSPVAHLRSASMSSLPKTLPLTPTLTPATTPVVSDQQKRTEQTSESVSWMDKIRSTFSSKPDNINNININNSPISTATTILLSPPPPRLTTVESNEGDTSTVSPLRPSVNENVKMIGKLTVFPHEILGRGSFGTVVCAGTYGEWGDVAVKMLSRSLPELIMGLPNLMPNISPTLLDLPSAVSISTRTSHSSTTNVSADQHKPNKIFFDHSPKSMTDGEVVETSSDSKHHKSPAEMFATTERAILRQVSQRFSHHHVIRYIGVEEDVDRVYLALEKCDFSLFEVMSVDLNSTCQIKSTDAFLGALKQSLMDYERSVTLMVQLTEGVKFLHAHGIVHGDIRPKNILFDSCGIMKISDFGLSRVVENQDDSFTWSHGAPTALQGWYAPEVYLRHRKTMAIDIFSMGCVFYYLLSGGIHPFGNAFNVVKSNHNLPYIYHLPEALDLVCRMIAEKPEDRPIIDEVMIHPCLWSFTQKIRYIENLGNKLDQFKALLLTKAQVSVAVSLSLPAADQETREVLKNHWSRPITASTRCCYNKLRQSMSEFSAEEEEDDRFNFRNLDPSSRLIGLMESDLEYKDWRMHLPAELITQMSSRRSYDGGSCADLIRFIRNVHQHFSQLPNSVKLSIATEGCMIPYTSAGDCSVFCSYSVSSLLPAYVPSSFPWQDKMIRYFPKGIPEEFASNRQSPGRFEELGTPLWLAERVGRWKLAQESSVDNITASAMNEELVSELLGVYFLLVFPSFLLNLFCNVGGGDGSEVNSEVFQDLQQQIGNKNLKQIIERRRRKT